MKSKSKTHEKPLESIMYNSCMLNSENKMISYTIYFLWRELVLCCCDLVSVRSKNGWTSDYKNDDDDHFFYLCTCRSCVLSSVFGDMYWNHLHSVWLIRMLPQVLGESNRRNICVYVLDTYVPGQIQIQFFHF